MTHDDILYGRLRLWQPEKGPRVSMDTVLLASWVRRPSGRRASFVELGAATGAVSLMLALRFSGNFRIVGLEIQPDLVALAERNGRENGLEDRVSFLCGDLRDTSLLPPDTFDGLVVNPPYEEPGRGRASPVEARSIARQGSRCSVADVAAASARLLKGRGRFFAVFRTDRMAAFIGAVLQRGLVPKRLRLIHPRPLKPSNLFLIECVKGGGEGLLVERPLFVHDEEGNYTPELLRAYEPEGLN
ncbi:MAG: methyltransferase domain-containing protein [Fretibacterium sp.]|nr:methyltransferase domain-containing protein [Fretibacterium sp.]